MIRICRGCVEAQADVNCSEQSDTRDAHARIITISSRCMTPISLPHTSLMTTSVMSSYRPKDEASRDMS
jgi:hypothetical protein